MPIETDNLPAVDIAVRTDPGRDPDKQVNEDAALHVETPLGLLAVVCDGMGGHAGGKEASGLAVTTIVELVRSAPLVAKPREVLRVAIEEANRRVWSMSTAESGHRPGSTVVAVLAHAGGAEIAHVGDSRIYYIHAGAISQITKDHSMVQEMVDRHIIRPEEAATHPDANKILRALGIAKDVEVESRSEPLAFVVGDTFVLCSDGLSDLVSPAEILDIAGSRPASQAVHQLVDTANARGGHDNITVLCMRMKGSAAKTDAATIVKTMQLTLDDAHGQAPPAPPSTGPRGTVLALPTTRSGTVTLPESPGTTQIGPPARVGPPPSYDGPPVSGPRSTRQVRSKAAPPVAVVVGIGLAVAAIVIAAVLLWALHRPRHVTVPVVEIEAGAPAASVTAGGAAEPAAELPETPQLPPPGAPAEGEFVVRPGETTACAQARRARETKRASAIVRTLDERCRASLRAEPDATPEAAPTLPPPTPTLPPPPARSL